MKSWKIHLIAWVISNGTISDSKVAGRGRRYPWSSVLFLVRVLLTPTPITVNFVPADFLK